MAMSVGGDSTETPMSDINTTPLVDVMLVLLIVFMIAVPVVLQTIPLKLPDVKYDPTQSKPEDVMLSIKSDDGQSCQVYLGMSPVTHDELQQAAVDKLKAVVARLGNNITPDDLPEVHIRGDQNTPYKCIGGAIFTMQSAGFARVGFISQPTGPGV
ncbi:MAG: ExbD/TolR family protein [Sphingomonas sp.]